MSKNVNCPYCGKPTSYSKDNPYRPFCSERCQMIDLGKWATEKYSIVDENETPEAEVNQNPNDDEDPDRAPLH